MGTDFVAGSTRVPSPAAGITAFVTFIAKNRPLSQIIGKPDTGNDQIQDNQGADDHQYGVDVHPALVDQGIAVLRGAGGAVPPLPHRLNPLENPAAVDRVEEETAEDALEVADGADGAQENQTSEMETTKQNQE